jgi:hypothetical protein
MKGRVVRRQGGSSPPPRRQRSRSGLVKGFDGWDSALWLLASAGSCLVLRRSRAARVLEQTCSMRLRRSRSSWEMERASGEALRVSFES